MLKNQKHAKHMHDNAYQPSQLSNHQGEEGRRSNQSRKSAKASNL